MSVWEGRLLLSIILVAMLAIAFHGWMRREQDRRASRLRDWADRNGWRMLAPEAGEGGQRGEPMPAWASGEEWRSAAIAIAGRRAGYEIVVAWGETLSYSGMDAATAVALHTPGPLPDLQLRRRHPLDTWTPADHDHDPETAAFDQRFVVSDISPESAHRLLTPSVAAAIARSKFPPGPGPDRARGPG